MSNRSSLCVAISGDRESLDHTVPVNVSFLSRTSSILSLEDGPRRGDDDTRLLSGCLDVGCPIEILSANETASKSPFGGLLLFL